ncbi:MAG: glycosyltransferase [Pleurocapsa minor GSE-CHR-MK-17-07R]|jgi:glycosyltransferase involved in cell wall biosynthesis|nr:glycosyltransferase [Pleurocapsa minor GSE-CHR-MK 17-07R]
MARTGIDISVLQGGSALRGMGRLTSQLIKALLAHPEPGDDFLLFHQLTDTISGPLADIYDLVQRHTGRARVVPLDFDAAGLITEDDTWRKRDEIVYTRGLHDFARRHAFDALHLPVYDDIGYYHTPRSWEGPPLVMTAHDLIPFRSPGALAANMDAMWAYSDALMLMRASSAVVANSQATRRDMSDVLGVAPERVFVASPFPEPIFAPLVESPALLPASLRRMGIHGRYIFAVTGFGENKNISGLLRAFAALPTALRGRTQLVISALVTAGDVPQDVHDLAAALGISGQIAWTGKTDDATMAALYQHARLVAHISLAEGFGLPIAEAMACGTPVVVTDYGASREVAGDAGLKVRPRNPAQVAEAFAALLTDDALHEQQRALGLASAARFTEAGLSEGTRMAYAFARGKGQPAPVVLDSAPAPAPQPAPPMPAQPLRDDLHVAMWTPLPPLASGISDYSMDLLRALTAAAPRMQFSVITAPEATATPIDGVRVYSYADYAAGRVPPVDVHVYHMGNNCAFHEEIHDQLQRERGIVVLHDLSLWGFYSFLYQHRGRPVRMRDEMTYQHGSGAAESLTERFFGGKSTDYLEHHMLRRITDHAGHIIVHSQFGAEHLRRYDPAVQVSVIPSGAHPSRNIATRQQVRASLHAGESDLVLGVFGNIQANKRIESIVNALKKLRSTAPTRFQRTRLLVVGYDQTEYAQRLKRDILEGPVGKQVTWLGETDFETFENLLQGVDIFLNLRHPTTGETSGTIMRALGAGCAVITSDQPQYADLPESFCWRVPVDDGEAPTLTALLAGLTHEKVQQAREEAYKYAQQAAWPLVAKHYLSQIQTCARLPVPAAVSPIEGMTIVGDLHVDNGLSQAARGLVSALRTLGVPLDYTEYPYDPLFRATMFPPPPAGAAYPVRIFMLNAPEFDKFNATEQLDASQAYNIGYWFYELAQLPPDWQDAFAGLDEIWVATRYVQANLQSVSPIPVRHVPLPLDVPVVTLPRPHFFDWPTDKYTFLFSFSALGSSARKNPFGVIDAFQKAYRDLPASKRPLLILKAHHLDHFPALLDAIKRRIHGWPIKLMLDQLSRDEMYGLIARCDCYVSLHRSEGLGLGMAEAMALGKPVIATGWSGNMDFMTAENSYPVPFRFAAVAREQHRYQESHEALYASGSAMWAEPDLDAAAGLMRKVFEQPESARQIGEAAAAHLRDEHSMSAVAHVLKETLSQVARQAPAEIARQAARKRHYQHALTRSSDAFPMPKRQVSPMTGSPSYSQADTTHASIDALQQAFADWDAIRLRDTDTRLSRFMRRIPVLGYLYRIVVRVLNLGRLEAAQMHLHRAMLHQMAALAGSAATAQMQAQASEELVSGLEVEVKGSIWPRLDSLETTRDHHQAELDIVHDHIAATREELAIQIENASAELKAVVEDFDELLTQHISALSESTQDSLTLMTQQMSTLSQTTQDRLTLLAAQMAQQQFSVADIARELQHILLSETDGLRGAIADQFATSMESVHADMNANYHALVQRLLQLEQQVAHGHGD